MKLHLAKGLTIDASNPRVVADGLRIFLTGESGCGKSTAAMLIVSQWVEQGGQVLVLDSHGEYGALWESRPANVTRFGYGEPPVGLESVEMCMSFLRDGQSLVLDLSHWTDLEPDLLDAFVKELMRDLYAFRRQQPKQMLVLMEEAQTFVPQQQSKGQADNVKLFTALITGGRKFGLNFILSSQRSSLVDSNIIAGCNVRIFMRTSEAKDWKKVLKGYIPSKLASFGGRNDIAKFDSGEAVVVSRWLPTMRVRLRTPSTRVKKFL
jgi:DNA helicase HerA-like ATPase